MISTLNEFLGLAEQWPVLAFLVFLRVGAAMAVLPVLGEQSVPVRIRLALALALTILVAPAVAGYFDIADLTRSQMLSLLGSEVFFGLIIGLSLRLFIVALQTAGAIAAQSTSLSQVFGGQAVDPQPAFGNLFVSAGLALAVTLGLHVQIISFLVFSYQVMTPGRPGILLNLTEWEVSQVARSFSLAFSLAAPFVIASLIYNIALGAINRAMPQLMVSFVGAPALTAGGLTLLLLATPLMMSAWYSALTQFLSGPFGSAP